MSRYVKDLSTAVSRDEAWAVITAYLQGEGFEYRDERGEQVWRKGVGALTVPQFIKAEPADGLVHIEAWTAGYAFLPGVYVGEMDPTSGVWGAAPKAMLKPRIAELERRLLAAATAPAPAPTAAPPSGGAG
ncbi:MAG: hypothetical protein CVT59_01650 [Actinobacteria bacterium HGW-Actinobacteria-1]|jgi:hypothetical protein|nr:MAG: hypothetical protein CVT59_01650 [Actinobacteria bacterium HGW-Actinobacteria-1]